MTRISILASSSSGNSTFLRGGNTRLLIDAGLSRKATFERISAIGEAPQDIEAILVTHEHSDHVAGLARIARKLGIPVYLTERTAPTIDWEGDPPRVETFAAGTGFRIGDIQVESFTIPHDAVDPVGFCLRTPDVKIGMVTDLGYVPDSIRVHLREADFLLLESNHDLEMLKVGPYPWSLKQRVMGRKGHLSNDSAAQFILDDLDPRLQTLVLGHISENNNHLSIVDLVARQALSRRGIAPRLVIAEPGVQTECFEL